MRPLKLSPVATVVLLVLIALLMMSCNEQPLSFVAENNREVISPEFQNMRTLAANLAKVLARDLNENDEHRKEVFSKIANKFDGDFDILFKHLYDRTISEIHQASKEASKTVEEINLREIQMTIPKLELMMPFMDNDWTDKKITEIGGLIVAYYPFGVDDRKIKEFHGYDKNGSLVAIKTEKAKSIPYLILRVSERTDSDGFLKSKLYEPNLKTAIKSASYHGIDPKQYAVTQRADWKEVNLTELGETKNLINLLPMVCYEDCGGGGGGGGNPFWAWIVTRVLVGDHYEASTEGQIEIYFKCNNQNSAVVSVPYQVGSWKDIGSLVIISNENGIPNTPVEMWDEDDIWDDQIIENSNHKAQFDYAGTYLRTFWNVNLSYPMGGYGDWTKLQVSGTGQLGGTSKFDVYYSLVQP